MEDSGRLSADIGIDLGINRGTETSQSWAIHIVAPCVGRHEALGGFDSFAQGDLVEFGSDELGVNHGSIEDAVARQLDEAARGGGDQGRDDGEEASSGRGGTGGMEPVVLWTALVSVARGSHLALTEKIISQ